MWRGAAPGDTGARGGSGKALRVVIARGGGRSGPPLEQACAAADLVVRRLRDGDRVNVIAFDHAVDPLFASPQPAGTAREAVLRFIGRIRAGGGAKNAAALRTAVRAQHGGLSA